MNKILVIFFVSVGFLILSSGVAQAAALCIDRATGIMNNNVQNFINNGNGIVPCGTSVISYNAGVLMTGCPCELGHFFVMLLKIFRFLLWNLATPIAGLMIVIGGLLILLSGGPGGNNPVTGIASPNMYSTGKKIIMFSIMGVVTMFCAWVIINVLMTRIIGINGWSILPF